MKYKFIISALGDDFVAVPLDSNNKNFSGLIRLNETGRDIFQGLMDGKNKEQITFELIEKYQGLDKEKANAAVEGMIEKLSTAGIIEK